MTNPLLLFFARPSTRQHGVRRPRERVRVPTEVPSTDAIFLVLRRMRTPLVVLVAIFSISVFGLALIPGKDGQRISPFDAFYFISYTATTIGFGTPSSSNCSRNCAAPQRLPGRTSPRPRNTYLPYPCAKAWPTPTIFCRCSTASRTRR